MPNVSHVAYSAQVPFEQSNSSRLISTIQGDEASESQIQVMRMEPEFLAAYDIQVIAGRNLDRNIANDVLTEDSETISRRSMCC